MSFNKFWSSIKKLVYDCSYRLIVIIYVQTILIRYLLRFHVEFWSDTVILYILCLTIIWIRFYLTSSQPSFPVDDIRFYNFDEATPDLASVDLDTYPQKGSLPGRRCVAFDPCYGSNAFDCGAITYFKACLTKKSTSIHLYRLEGYLW